MKKFCLLFSIATLFGCTASVTLHEYLHFGGEVRPIGNFRYVMNGVTGGASAIYTQYGGGEVKTGLLAEAKRNLWMKHPLAENQAYVNMSFDQSITKLGYISQGNIIARQVEVRVVVSADIVEYERSGTDWSSHLDTKSTLSTQNIPTTSGAKFEGFRAVEEEEMTKGRMVFVDSGLAMLEKAEIVSTRKRGDRIYATVSVSGNTSLVPISKVYLNE